MSSLGDLTHWVARQIKGVFEAIVGMADSRDQLMLFADATGTPIIVDTAQLDALRAIAKGEATAQLIEDSLEVIEGFRDAFHRYVELRYSALDPEQQADRAIELMLRALLPPLRWWFHHTRQAGASLILELIAILDDKIGEANPGFTAARVVAVYREARDAGYEGQPRALLLPVLAPVAEFTLQKLLTFAPRYYQELTGGWESPHLDQEYGRPQPWRDTPTWMAQRTTSVHIIEQPSFTLDRYKHGTPTPEPTSAWGITVVPVPKQRAWLGAPADAPMIADTRGPATWLQVDVQGDKDVELADGWSIHVRGFGDIGVEIPLGGDADVADVAGAGAGVEVELQWTAPTKAPDPPATPTTPSDIDQGGDFGGATVELDKVSFIVFAGGGVGSLHDRGGDLGIAIKLSKLHVAVTPKSQVLGALVKRNLSFTTDLGFMVSSRGISFQGANGLDLYINTRVSLLGFTLTYLRISGIYEKKTRHLQLRGREYDVKVTEIGAQITAGIEIGYSKLKFFVDGIGAKVLLQTRRPDGNLLGLGHVDGDVVLPSGLGLRVDFAGCVQGGGFFSFDRTLDRFSGGLEIGFGRLPKSDKPKWVLRGVGFSEPRPAGEGETEPVTTMLGILTAELAAWGLGALVGTHRGMDLEAIVAALPTGALDALLFPQDPLGKTAQIVNAFATMFPAAKAHDDKHVLGLFGKYSWASLASISLGVIAEFSGSWGSWPTKIAVPFSLKFGEEGKLKSLFWIEVDGIGAYDAGLEIFELHAVLRNSRIFGADFVGGLVIFHGDPDPNDVDVSRGWFLSAGGYHPSYYGGKGPARARVDNRLGLVISRGNNVKLELSAYIAKSPAGYHFGFFGHLFIGAVGFSFDGKLWLDALVHSVHSWVIDVGGSIALILFGETITELKLEGEWSRTDRVYFAGKVSFKVLWWSVSKHTEREMTSELGTTTVAIDVHAAMARTLTDPQSYPNTLPGEVTLTNATRNGVWNAPEQPLAFVQKVAPLDMQLERIDATVLDPPVTLVIGPVSIAGHDRDKKPALSEFSPAAFLELDTDAALHAPAGELWSAGFIAGDECAAGDEEPAVAEFDELTIDRAQLAPKRRRFPLSELVLAAWNSPATVATVPPIRVQPAAFTSRLADAPSTFAKAWALRGTALRRSEGTR